MYTNIVFNDNVNELYFKPLLSYFPDNSCRHQRRYAHSADIADIYSVKVIICRETAHTDVFCVVQVADLVVIKGCSTGSQCWCNDIIIKDVGAEKSIKSIEVFIFGIGKF